MRYNIRTLFICVSVIAILAATVGGINRSVKRAYGTFEDFYAIEQTSMMLIDYTMANEGAWPSSWDDLRPHFDEYKHLGWSADFEAHKELVDVDFAFDPTTYFSRDPPTYSAPLKLISVKSKRNDNDWEELKEVNRRLVAALRSLHESK